MKKKYVFMKDKSVRYTQKRSIRKDSIFWEVDLERNGNPKKN